MEQVVAQRDGLEVFNRRIAAALTLDQQKLDRAFSDAMDPHNLRTQGAIGVAVNRPSGSRPYLATMAPTSRHLGDKHGAIALALVVYEVGNQKPLDAEILMKYFRLTPAEARISIGLALGRTLKIVAAENLVAISTARSQLKSINLKTDTNSQSELVSLIGSFPSVSE